MNEPPTTESLQSSLKHLGIYDYIILFCVLTSEILIGAYNCLFDKNDDCELKYLVGRREMRPVPVAISLVGSVASSIAFLDIFSEVYLTGIQYIYILISIFLSGLIGLYLILPVFHKMKLASSYEYLERRFDRNVRILGFLMFVVSQICWLLYIICIPGLAFHKVSGVNINIVTPCVTLICVLYTCWGGLKTVVLTSALKILIMGGLLILISVEGSLQVGGFSEVWEKNEEDGRLFALDSQSELWSIIVGGLIMWIQESVINQCSMQRYLSLPSMSEVRQTSWIFALGSSGFIFLCSYTALVFYTIFFDCDPLTTKLIDNKEEILPLMIMKVFANSPGFSGLFIAVTISFCVTSVSTGLNSLSTVFLEDMIKPWFTKKVSSKISFLVTRGTVIAFGILLVSSTLFVENIEPVLKLFLSLKFIISGSMFGLFCSGIFIPWINSKGALFGSLLSLFGSGFVVLGAQNAISEGRLNVVSKPMSVEGCLYYYNSTVLSGPQISDSERIVFPLFRLGTMWYTAFGGILTVVLAFVISGFTGFTNTRTLDTMCVSPVMRFRFSKSRSKILRLEEEELINKLKNNTL